MTDTCYAPNRDKWEIYKDNASEWRWRRTASNGQIVGASSEGYKTSLTAFRMLSVTGCHAFRPKNGLRGYFLVA